MMKNITKITFLLILFNFKITAQNTTFDNVGIGTGGPTYGVQIKTNFPGYTGGWARYFSVANSDGTLNYITMGTYGDMTNGSTSFNRSYIGKDWDNTYLDFLSNGNIGIRTKNPQNILQIGEFKNSSNFKISMPGVYNFEELKLGQYGNGANGLEMISHTGLVNSFGVRLFCSTDTGINGLQIQTALPSNSSQGLNYITRMAIDVNGKIGIGTITPRAKLDNASDISNGELGTVFGRLPEGDGTGSGTYLGVKGYATQGADVYQIKSFSIVHDFYGQTNNSINFYRGGSVLGGFMTFNTSDNTEKMRIATNGNVGIGTINPTSKLTVAGNINSREVKVSVDAGADFVFDEEYDLPSLASVETFIKENKHLPEIASAKEMQANGINLSQMNIKLLQKMEEMTLYMIETKKENEAMKNKQQQLENRLLKIEKK